MNIKRKVPFSLFQKTAQIKNWLQSTEGYPLSANKLSCTPFFIVGSGRSGNTLLRKMLEASNKVAIPPESYVLARAARKFLLNNHKPWELVAESTIREFEAHPEFSHWHLTLAPAITAGKKLSSEHRSFANLIDVVYQEYAKARYSIPPKMWGDKTPTNALFFDHIYSAFPNAKYIHLLRTPQAVFVSYLKSGLVAVEKQSDKHAIIDLWLDSNRKILAAQSKKNKAQFILVQYEQLVSDPKKELTRICRHIGIEFMPTLLEYWKTEAKDDVRAHHHHQNVRNPLDVYNINRWQAELSDEDRELIESRCMSLYNQLRQC